MISDSHFFAEQTVKHQSKFNSAVFYIEIGKAVKTQIYALFAGH